MAESSGNRIEIDIERVFGKRQLQICRELKRIEDQREKLRERESRLKAEFWELNNPEKSKAFMKAMSCSQIAVDNTRLYLISLLQEYI